MESKLTQKRLAKLHGQTGRREVIRDDRVPGLQAELRPGGTVTFSVFRRRRGGGPVRVTIGTFPSITVQQARRQAASIVAKLAVGADPRADAKEKVRRGTTLGATFEAFLAAPTRSRSKRPKAPGTIQDYRLWWNKHLKHLNDRRLGDVKREELESLHDAIGNTCGKPVANRAITLLKGVFNFAIDQGHNLANPAARLRMFAEESRTRFLQRSELPAFLDALDRDPSEKFRDFVYLLLFTGQRRTTVQEMRWVDVDFERELWVIPHAKTGKHQVPLIGEALQILRRRFEDRGDGDQFVLPGRHEKECLRTPQRQWRALCKRANIANLTMHDIRRSAASWQALGGVSLPTIGRMLGHKSPGVTMIYSRLDDEAVRTAMRSAAVAMLAAGRPK